MTHNGAFALAGRMRLARSGPGPSSSGLPKMRMRESGDLFQGGMRRGIAVSHTNQVSAPARAAGSPQPMVLI